MLPIVRVEASTGTTREGTTGTMGKEIIEKME